MCNDVIDLKRSGIEIVYDAQQYNNAIESMTQLVFSYLNEGKTGLDSENVIYNSAWIMQHLSLKQKDLLTSLEIHLSKKSD